jgi:hypothetical protein
MIVAMILLLLADPSGTWEHRLLPPAERVYRGTDTYAVTYTVLVTPAKRGWTTEWRYRSQKEFTGYMTRHGLGFVEWCGPLNVHRVQLSACLWTWEAGSLRVTFDHGTRGLQLSR